MEKLIITICLGIILLIPSTLKAEEVVVDSIKDWSVIRLKDEFTDEVTYFLGTEDALRIGHPGIGIRFNNNNNTESILLFIDSKILGSGITYRIDKKPAVTLRCIQTTDGLIDEKRSNKLIGDFKKGKTVIYRVHSSNQFIENKTERVSLIGFTKLFDKVNKLANKGE